MPVTDARFVQQAPKCEVRGQVIDEMFRLAPMLVAGCIACTDDRNRDRPDMPVTRGRHLIDASPADPLKILDTALPHYQKFSDTNSGP